MSDPAGALLLSEQEVTRVREAAELEISRAGSQEALEHARVKYLGRRGEVTRILRGLGVVPKEDLPRLGRLVNSVKGALEGLIEERTRALQSAGPPAGTPAAGDPAFDVTLPGRTMSSGHRHPVPSTLEEIVGIFRALGFAVAEGPQVESDWYNFAALNIPPDHPARDMQATFYLTAEEGGEPLLLRTHTSPVQIRAMKGASPPMKVIAPGRVFRCDADVSHLPMFHQVEGFSVGKGVSFADLKGTLETFVRMLFGAGTAMRLRPSYFPFTEPSTEMDVRCSTCQGKGCRVCRQSGWLEILGAGMIHPEVFRAVGYPPGKWTGFAFGLGVERIAMIRNGISDIRLLVENDLRFLGRF